MGILDIPSVDLPSQFDGNSISNIPIGSIRKSLEHFLTTEDSLNKTQKSLHLRILLCFMCGGETNDVKTFCSQLSSRFSFINNDQPSFMINTFLGRSNRKVK